MRKIYTKPEAWAVELRIADILLTSGTRKLQLEEETAEVSDLSRFLWNDLQED